MGDIQILTLMINWYDGSVYFPRWRKRTYCIVDITRYLYQRLLRFLWRSNNSNFVWSMRFSELKWLCSSIWPRARDNHSYLGVRYILPALLMSSSASLNMHCLDSRITHKILIKSHHPLQADDNNIIDPSNVQYRLLICL